MRASILLVPIALSTLASMPVAAQEAPRVIFCTGQCTAIDEKGIRTPAPKGTQLRENQRLETGPGAYAQVKLGHDVALGIGEGAQIRFDQRSVRGSDVVILDQGRVRMLDGTAIGKATTRALELRTTDGRFGLKGADIEVKAPPRGRGTDSSTFVKLNVGEARFLNSQGGVAIAKDSVHGFTGGKAITNKSVSLADVVMTRRSAVTPSRPAEPIANLPAVSLPVQTSALRNDLSLPGLSAIPGLKPVLSPTLLPSAPVLSSGEILLLTPVVVPDPITGVPTKTTLTNLVTSPTLTAVAPTSGISPVTTPVLTTSTLLTFSAPKTTPIVPLVITTIPKLLGP